MKKIILTSILGFACIAAQPSVLAQDLWIYNNTKPLLYSTVKLISGPNQGSCAYTLDSDAYTGPPNKTSAHKPWEAWFPNPSIKAMCGSFPCLAEIFVSDVGPTCNQGQRVSVAALNSNGTIVVSTPAATYKNRTIHMAGGSYQLTISN